MNTLVLSKALRAREVIGDWKTGSTEAAKLEQILISLREHCTGHPSLQSLQLLALGDEVILSRYRPHTQF